MERVRLATGSADLAEVADVADASWLQRFHRQPKSLCFDCEFVFGLVQHLKLSDDVSPKICALFQEVSLLACKISCEGQSSFLRDYAFLDKQPKPTKSNQNRPKVTNCLSLLVVGFGDFWLLFVCGWLLVGAFGHHWFLSVPRLRFVAFACFCLLLFAFGCIWLLLVAIVCRW